MISQESRYKLISLAIALALLASCLIGSCYGQARQFIIDMECWNGGNCYYVKGRAAFTDSVIYIKIDHDDTITLRIRGSYHDRKVDIYRVAEYGKYLGTVVLNDRSFIVERYDYIKRKWVTVKYIFKPQTQI
jgi:hypothetical protein